MICVRDYFINVEKWEGEILTIKLDIGDLPYTTKYFPQTYDILSRQLPSVLNTTCHNPKNLPFNEHVKDTVLGHMFEHILIEFLCDEKIISGAHEAEYSGITEWNWIEQKRGVFHIKIKVNSKEENIFFNALKRALELFEEILRSGKELIEAATASAAPAYAKAAR